MFKVRKPINIKEKLLEMTLSLGDILLSMVFEKQTPDFFFNLQY